MRVLILFCLLACGFSGCTLGYLANSPDAEQQQETQELREQIAFELIEAFSGAFLKEDGSRMFVVDLFISEALGDNWATTERFGDGHFRIDIDETASTDVIPFLLHHEWAHILVWNDPQFTELDIVPHSANWGKAYATLERWRENNGW